MKLHIALTGVLGLACHRSPPTAGPNAVHTTDETLGAQATSDGRLPPAAMRNNAIYMPDPDQKALAQTESALLGDKPLRTTVTYCVDAHGTTVDVETAKASADAEVDRICRQAVTNWRFRPFMVNGAAKRTCSSAKFDIVFGDDAEPLGPLPSVPAPPSE